MNKFFFWAIFIVTLSTQSTYGQAHDKNRVMILSDIGADPDDTQSFVRLLLYSNQLDLKGLIATTSVWQKTRVAPESIKKIIAAYGKVQTNLNRHERGFPPVDSLLMLVKQGPSVYGMQAVGNGRKSEGSDWIIQELEKDDSRPLYISVWGGVNTLAQALFTLKASRPVAELKQLVSRLRVYTISDQDDSGIWIRNNFPDLFYIVSPGDNYGSATWSAINSPIKDISNAEITNQWIAENIQQGHGPLGASYPDVSWGMEGDTPAFLWLIPNGLNHPEHPDWGGWGGRYELAKPEFSKQKRGTSGVPFETETRPIWTDASDTYIPVIPNDIGRAVKQDSNRYHDNKATLWRWRHDFQNDFAARLDWCLKDYASANHSPVPVIDQKGQITVRSGQGFGIDASASYDPDGDNFGYLWFYYPEAGSYKGELNISPENYPNVWLTAPKVQQPETIHIILKLVDKGQPALAGYRRIIIRVIP